MMTEFLEDNLSQWTSMHEMNLKMLRYIRAYFIIKKKGIQNLKVNI